MAYAESGFSDEASSSCCHGVWALHSSYYDVNCARNLDCATREAVKTSKNGTDWSAWDVHPDSMGRTGFVSNSRAIRNYERAKTKFASLVPKWIPQIDLGPVTLTPFGGLPDVDEIPGIGGVIGDVAGLPGEVIKTDADFLGLGGILEPFEDVAEFFQNFSELFLTAEGWKRLGFILGGSTLLLIGLLKVMNSGYGIDAVGGAKRGATKVAAAAVTKGAVK